MGAPIWPPKPRSVRSAPAKPWRSSGVRSVQGHDEAMAPPRYGVGPKRAGLEATYGDRRAMPVRPRPASAPNLVGEIP